MNHTTEEPLKIRVKYHTEQPPLCFVDDKSDWIDLRAAETVSYQAGDYKEISLGVSVELPEGYEAHIVPRSSTFRKYGIQLPNSVGIIDNSYNGDNDVWHFLAHCVRPGTVHAGDRICQFRIVKKQPPLEFVTVEHLGNPDRGGLGSTGTV